MTTPSRRSELKRRRTRKEKIASLRRRYQAAASETERNKLFEKVRKLSPLMTLEAFTAPARKQGATAS